MPFYITNIVKPKLIKNPNLHPKSHFLAIYGLIQKLTFASDHPVYFKAMVYKNVSPFFLHQSLEPYIHDKLILNAVFRSYLYC